MVPLICQSEVKSNGGVWRSQCVSVQNTAPIVLPTVEQYYLCVNEKTWYHTISWDELNIISRPILLLYFSLPLATSSLDEYIFFNSLYIVIIIILACGRCDMSLSYLIALKPWRIMTFDLTDSPAQRRLETAITIIDSTMKFHY